MDTVRTATLVAPARGRLLLLVVPCGVFALIGFGLTRADLGWLVGLGAVLLAGFVLAAAVLLARAWRPGPTVRIDAEGITERTGLAPTGLVRWEEIAAVRKREIGRGVGAERLLEIVLLDEDEFRRRPRNLVRRVADRYRAMLKQPDVAIPGSMVAMPLGALIDELRRWRPELTVLELPPRRSRRRGGHPRPRW